jgi:Type I phosphodiesterase / nucleotide pyrophosphatase
MKILACVHDSQHVELSPPTLSAMKLLMSALCIATAAAKVDHVIYISVDGLHSIDEDLYSKLKPDSTIASFFSKGVVYKNATTSMPSDSFPGLMNDSQHRILAHTACGMTTHTAATTSL